MEVWKGERLHVVWLGRNMDIKAVACVTTGANNGPFACTPTPCPRLGSTAAVSRPCLLTGNRKEATRDSLSPGAQIESCPSTTAGDLLPDKDNDSQSCTKA